MDLVSPGRSDGLVPQQVSGLSTNVIDIYTGGFSSCGKINDGSFKCWGLNSYGILGDGGTTDSNVPVVVTAVSSVRSFGMGDFHNCSVSNSGAAKCWGFNSYGALGAGQTDSVYLTAQDVSGLGAGVVEIAAGLTSTCALLSTGAIKCWGKITEGQVGGGTFGGGAETISHIQPSEISTGTDMVSAGGYHLCALSAAGNIKCSGQDSYGQLGDGNKALGNPLGFDSFKEVSSLNGTINQVASGLYHTCVLTSVGGVKCWGKNNNGELGDSTVVTRASPIDVTGLLSGVNMVASGGYHTCALVSDGTVKCWGRNDFGQLGTGTTSSSPTTTPQVVIGLSNVVQITAGLSYTCARLSDNTVKCWGRNVEGQLGDASTTDRSSPVTVSSLSNVTDISTGFWHTCALTSNGSVYCWGNNTRGQLGNGDNVNYSTPQLVFSGTGTPKIQISAGAWHTCLLQNTSGDVKCWGSNSRGQLGVGDTAFYYPTPQFSIHSYDYPGDITQISSGRDFTCARVDTGATICWGSNLDGQLGDGNASQIIPNIVSGIDLF